MATRKSMEFASAAILSFFVPQIIGIGAGKFLGVRRNFARILSYLPEKYFIKSDLKKSSSCQFGRHYFQIKAYWAPFLLRFSGSFRRFSEILPGFRRILPGLYGISPGFSPNQNFGGAVAPPPPTPVPQSPNFWHYPKAR